MTAPPKASTTENMQERLDIIRNMTSKDVHTTVSARAAVPPLYRHILLTIEPFLAVVLGSFLVFTFPRTYLASVTRNAMPFDPNTTFLYTALGGSWLYFAFIEVVMLRLVDDLFLWRVLCGGMLLSDGAFLHATAQAVGGWGEYAKLGEWTGEDWAGFWLTAPMVLTRVAIVLGIGLRWPKGEDGGGKRASSAAKKMK